MPMTVHTSGCFKLATFLSIAARHRFTSHKSSASKDVVRLELSQRQPKHNLHQSNNIKHEHPLLGGFRNLAQQELHGNQR